MGRSVGKQLVCQAGRALAAVLKEIAHRSGGTVCEEDGLLLVAGDHPCPVLINSALRTGTMNAAEVLRRAQSFFGELGRGWETWIRAGTDTDLELAARAQGMCAAPDLIGMVLEALPDLPEPRPGVELSSVTDIQTARDFSEVAADGFSEEAPGISDLVHALFSDVHMLHAPDTQAFVVRYAGRPVSTAMVMVKEDVAWIGWVATRVHARGLGLGQLATAAATRAGFALGARLASLEATAVGVPIYLRLGYREILRYRNYWPAGLLDS